MNASYLNVEIATIRSRTRKSTWVSIVLHSLLFLCIYLTRGISPEAEALVEVSWIEPAANTPVVAKSKSQPEELVIQTRSVRKIPEYFVRKKVEADLKPEPQITRVYQDKLNKRLTSLQRDATEKRAQIATLAAANIVANTTLAGVAANEEQSRTPGELARQRTRGGKPVALQRTPVRPSRPALAGTAQQQIEVTPEPARPTDSTVRRTLAGASLSGPVADRPLVSYSTPVYPEWAKRDGIEGASTIYFVVLPGGQVKQNVVVEKTSGFEEFDRNAVEALLAWRFQPLGKNETGEQWGRITFHYRLSNAGSS